MKSFSSIFLIIGYLSIINSENQKEETRRMLPIALNYTETNETSLSSETLSELHDLAKNISHSKGIYRQTDKESVKEQELRRSFLRKVTVASESDVMKDILEKIRSGEEKLELLQHLEFLVHQYDVAVNFASIGGLKIVASLLFSPDDDIVSCVASVLGAAMQSNPTVQQFAVNHSIGRNLLKLLSHRSSHVLSRIIFALGSLLRNAPEAQEEFLSTNGTSKLANILKDHHVTTNTKLKIINLFNDLAVEQQMAELYPDSKNSDEIQKFKRLFGYEIQTCDICKIIPSFLYLEDFDTHQNIVTAMMSLYSVCYKDFKNVAINNRLNKLLKIYDPESGGENPLYPSIDKDLKELLCSEIRALYKKINEDFNHVSSKSKLKTEL